MVPLLNRTVFLEKSNLGKPFYVPPHVFRDAIFVSRCNWLRYSNKWMPHRHCDSRWLAFILCCTTTSSNRVYHLFVLGENTIELLTWSAPSCSGSFSTFLVNTPSTLACCYTCFSKRYWHQTIRNKEVACPDSITPHFTCCWLFKKNMIITGSKKLQCDAVIDTRVYTENPPSVAKEKNRFEWIPCNAFTL